MYSLLLISVKSILPMYLTSRLKLYFQIFSIACICFLTSCDKKDLVNANLEGKWIPVKLYDPSNPLDSETYAAGSYMLIGNGSLSYHWVYADGSTDDDIVAFVKDGNKLDFGDEYAMITKLTSTSLLMDLYDKGSTTCYAKFELKR